LAHIEYKQRLQVCICDKTAWTHGFQAKVVEHACAEEEYKSS
jgi:hypothetical protein